MSPAATTPVTPAAARPPRAEKRRARLEAGRRTLARIPLTCVACAAIAFVNGALWAIITPSFQTPDEAAHAGYVQYVASGEPYPGTGSAGPTSSRRRWPRPARASRSRSRGAQPGSSAMSVGCARRWRTRIAGPGAHWPSHTTTRRCTTCSTPFPTGSPDLRTSSTVCCHAAVLGAAGSHHGRLHVPVRARGPARPALGGARRRARRRLPADVRIHVGRREQRQPSLHLRRGAHLPRRARTEAWPHAVAGSRDRGRRGCRHARQKPGSPACSREPRWAWSSPPGGRRRNGGDALAGVLAAGVILAVPFGGGSSRAGASSTARPTRPPRASPRPRSIR